MSKKNKYNIGKVSSKWSEKWLEAKIYEPDIRKSKKPFYNLMMFPYPSAEGLHVGNAYAFCGADIYGRFKRMSGYSVFEPIGLDGFGIHSENYAIKIGEHPGKVAKRTQENFYRQLKELGNGYDWEHKLETYDPDYYRWTQWVFIQMFKKGLAYKGEAKVNWCPSCKTVLADEQTENNKCERCKNEVERKEMSSWYFKITEYADRLLEGIEKIDWPEMISHAQRTWIGKKEGININYKVKGTEKEIVCFTTRPDTNFGATFVVMSPEKAKEMIDLVPEDQKNSVSKYTKEALNKSEQQRLEEAGKKTGVFTGLYVINEFNGCEMPIWVGDFVLSGVGTGVVVGVPGHDRRDFEFAKEFELEIKRVVVGSDGDKSKITKIEQVQEGEGKMVNSEFLDGMDIHKATKKMMDYIEEKGWGERTANYHLRDWLVSRQRYWGPPIPMINCEKCGWIAEDEANLPVLLPEISDYKPKGDGTSPLANAPESWKKVKCPKCGGDGERELDVSDTFLDSSWYFLAYPNLGTKEYEGSDSLNGNQSKQKSAKPFNDEITKKWLPVNAYIGGAEHAVLHLLYSRFVTMALKDMKYIDFDEPFPYLFGHGLIIKDGAKMSKSKGNVVNPDEYIEKYGADVLRMYLMFLGPFSAGGDFSDAGIEGMNRFLMRVYDLFQDSSDSGSSLSTAFRAAPPNGGPTTKDDSLTAENRKLRTITHQTIKRVTDDMEKLRFNTAIAALMEYVNELRSQNSKSKTQNPKECLKVLVQMLAPFAPFMTEELWVEKLGEEFSVHTSEWPKYDSKYIKVDQVDVVVQINGRLRATLKLKTQISKSKTKVVEEAKEEKNVKKYLEGKKVKKIVFVEGKIVNFVTEGE